MEVFARLEQFLRDKQMYDRFDSDLETIIKRAKSAFTDPLTEIPNRAGLIAGWPEMAQAEPVVALLDLNGFKPLNDSYGHGAGDLVLVAVAERLCGISEGGLVARLGGDEFCVIQKRESEVALGELIYAEVARPIAANGFEFQISASVGLVRASDDNLSAALALADAAMYRAKVARERYAIYSPETDRNQDNIALRPAFRLRDL